MSKEEEQIKPPHYLEIEEMIEEAENIPFWEARVIYDEKVMVYRLACAQVVQRLLRGKPPFNQIEELKANQAVPVEWSIRYIQKGKALINGIGRAFIQMENVLNLKEGVFETFPVTTLKLEDDGWLAPTDPVDGIMLSMVIGPTKKIQEDFRTGGDFAYPLFPVENSPCYLLRKDKIVIDGTFVFSLAVADRLSILEFVGDQSNIKNLF